MLSSGVITGPLVTQGSRNRYSMPAIEKFQYIAIHHSSQYMNCINLSCNYMDFSQLVSFEITTYQDSGDP